MGQRIILGWSEGLTAPFRPIEELTWCSGLIPTTLKARADNETCSYVEEGAGLGSSFSTIAEALAYADFQGHVVINRDAALAEQARRRGWIR